ncbi:S66 family peptidase [Paenibacillus xerothermodurans]|uniref:LD-carboxypeptidase n=1 Tax=Paenibacillus xerothermodurans TaxID=1977292 RepID=A0A2W1NNZ6_PAEXE|nr:S66 peptidase family protein [Paenibacillus xerothermodurans]PZE20643.1 LD-carboxypeptidase [Paenibacillus xerothermodurans]
MIKAKRMMPGSRIAIISPSSGLPHLFPEIYELGLKSLQEVMGFEVVEMPAARMSSDDLYRNPQLRANDINKCFKDNSIDGVITSIGGYESIRILPFLDTETIINNPKFIMGFSDATTFLTYLNQLGMVTFYGPSVMAGLAQIKNLPSEYTQHLKSILFANQFPYEYTPFKKWTNGYRDWSDLDTLGECEQFYENRTGWTFLQGNSVEQGYLWGGCIDVLEFMKSTIYWPSESFWEDKVLFFETSEEKPSPRQVGYFLRNYGMQGIFSRIKGVIFGRAKDYTGEEKLKLNEIIVDVIKGEFGAEKIPVVVDFDFGHTDPKLILPLGGKVELNPDTNEIKLLDSPFTEAN